MTTTSLAANRSVRSVSTQTRTPLLPLTDISSSMTGEPLAALNEALPVLRNEVLADNWAAKSVDIGLLTFGGRAELLLDLVPIQEFQPPPLTARGGTPMGAAILLALETLERYRQQCNARGVHLQIPLTVLFSDGAPTDPMEEATARLVEEQREGRVHFFAVGVGPAADFEVLKRLSVQREPLPLADFRFAALMQFLGRSLRQYSRSRPGERLRLPPLGWDVLGGQGVE